MPISQRRTQLSREMAPLRLKRTEGMGASGQMDLLVYVVINHACEGYSNMPKPNGTTRERDNSTCFQTTENSRVSEDSFPTFAWPAVRSRLTVYR